MTRSSLITTAAFLAAFSLTAAQAEPTPDAAAPSGGGAAAPATPGGGMDQPGNMTAPSQPAAPKDSTAGDAAKDRKGTEGAERTMPSDSKEGMRDGDKAGSAGMSKDDKSGATADSKADAKAKDGKSARLESQEVSKVRTYFRDNKPTAKRIDRNEVNVSIGIALPGAIALYDLPPSVIVVTGPCPVKYFVWDDDIVLVDSCTREVVEIIADVA